MLAGVLSISLGIAAAMANLLLLFSWVMHGLPTTELWAPYYLQGHDYGCWRTVYL